MVKKFYTIIASFCVILGAFGVFIPMLPTTPFLLAAIYLYMRSSKKGVKMILGNKILSPYVKSYFSKKGMSNKFYIRTLILLWCALIVSATFSISNIYARLFLLAVGISVTVHLTIKKKNKSI